MSEGLATDRALVRRTFQRPIWCNGGSTSAHMRLCGQQRFEEIGIVRFELAYNQWTKMETLPFRGAASQYGQGRRATSQ